MTLVLRSRRIGAGVVGHGKCPQSAWHWCHVDLDVTASYSARPIAMTPKVLSRHIRSPAAWMSELWFDQ